MTRTWSVRAPWYRGTTSRVKQFFFLSSLEFLGITKHLMTGLAEKSEFYFPSCSMFSSDFPRETFKVRLGETKNSLFLYRGQSISTYWTEWSTFQGLTPRVFSKSNEREAWSRFHGINEHDCTTQGLIVIKCIYNKFWDKKVFLKTSFDRERL